MSAKSVRSWRCCAAGMVEVHAGRSARPRRTFHGNRFEGGRISASVCRGPGRAFGIACASGTAALEVALKALGIGPGDEVVVPPYSFITTATAPLLIGATPVFCDIDPETLNLDPKRLESAITPRTKAMVPVHFAGLAADMGEILAISNAMESRCSKTRRMHTVGPGTAGAWEPLAPRARSVSRRRRT